MEKRYQVFVSSTFVDLKEERQVALRAILELDHMPAGMELFPASDDSAWELIRDVINASDYYVLVIGGRYGSLDEQGLGYTEKEYDYAYSTKKPVVALLHGNPDNLPRDKTETDQESWEKLKSFREKVEKRHTCKYWKDAAELKSNLVLALSFETKRHPGVGWVRADRVPSAATVSDVLFLRQKVDELEAELSARRAAPPSGTEDLMQGDDEYQLHFMFKARRSQGDLPWEHDDVTVPVVVYATWNEIFAGVAPKMITEASDTELREALKAYFIQVTMTDLARDDDLRERKWVNYTFLDSTLDTCVVQLRALGLIEESKRKRSVRDTGTYWSLTQFGDHQMVLLRALRRTALPGSRSGARAERLGAAGDKP